MITLQKSLGYEFKDVSLLKQAFVHKSFFNETDDKLLGHNERLEFLGDSVLDLSMSHILMNTFPEYDEGHLSKLRASLVNENAFAEMAVELNLQEKMMLGKGEVLSGGQDKPRLLASVFEALIGAMYLDGGYDQTHKFIEKVYMPKLRSIKPEEFFAKDYKTRLQEVTQELFKMTPSYKTVSSKGPDHNKIFSVEVTVDGKHLASGEGKSKKQAEQDAAQQALEALK